MPSNWSMVDNNFPTFTGNETAREQVRLLSNYLFALTEQLKYNLANLDTSNWNQKAMQAFQKDTTKDVEKDLQKQGQTLEGMDKTLKSMTEALEKLTKTSDSLAKWKEEMEPVLTDMKKMVDALTGVVQIGEDGSAVIGTEGKELRLMGTVYVNGVLLE